ncbi:M50 family metallopeptidase [Legionella jamestowniensis]|uniref:Membrane associated zinc metalloprotease n=1 Tax=Legionella jamestowniensis TaxID=455 RepID=A0A0W0ULA1_9GAMM|nr:M50 family metallopeptidase [Legionella jamestowniensis]KTD08686.1 membrane associated zinc metalloprotease [Legionella jamestowniensis]OCH96871.1 peptidase [Legionella jamestowniensis]SFL54964.1 regulator of sigma E protease [Legionella jamestowniensis DSM 19215]
MLWAILAILLTLILVVGIHEAGHALAARIFGVKIQKISIGFGKPLITWTTKAGQKWVWALWPLGGYVQLLNSRIQPVSEEELPFCFDKQPVWKRCIILLSGAFANLIAAWLALTLLFMVGYQQTPPRVQTVTTDSIAGTAGLKSGDRFLSLGDQKVNSWQETGMRLIMMLGKNNVPAVVEDNQGRHRPITLNLSQWRYQRGQSLLQTLGIEPESGMTKGQVKGETFFNAFAHAVTKSLQLLSFFLVMLKQVLTGVIPFAVLLGPIGLFTASVTSFVQGFTVFLYFIASLSLAVGLVNLFPIPGLDGGLIMYALLEKIRGKPLSVPMEILLHQLATIIFVVLLIQLILNDLQRYFH